MFESVNDLTDGIVICRCIAKIKSYIIPKHDEDMVVAAKFARMELAEYNLNLLKKNGKLRPGICENELRFRIKDLEEAQKAAFRT